MRIAITGTRQIEPHTQKLSALFEQLLTPFAARGCEWMLGGAAGVDTVALQFLARTEKHLVVAVPARLEDQPADAGAAVAEARRAGRLARLVELAHPEGVGSAAFTARNRWLVDHSDLVIGFPLHPVDDGSGTWETLRYAAELGKPYLVASLQDA